VLLVNWHRSPCHDQIRYQSVSVEGPLEGVPTPKGPVAPTWKPYAVQVCEWVHVPDAPTGNQSQPTGGNGGALPDIDAELRKSMRPQTSALPCSECHVTPPKPPIDPNHKKWCAYAKWQSRIGVGEAASAWLAAKTASPWAQGYALIMGPTGVKDKFVGWAIGAYNGC